MRVPGILVILMVIGGLLAAVPAPAVADPPTRACRSFSNGGKTFALRVHRLSCRKARRMMRAGLTNSGVVRGNPAYTISASDCEGILWRLRDLRYSQRHDGAISSRARFARFRVTYGCVG